MDLKILQTTTVYVLAALAVTTLSIGAQAVEYIESFDVELTVHTDGSVDIVESITVHSEGREIRHGIFRDILTTRGAAVRIDYVRRDGTQESWHSERIPGGKRYYLGKEAVLLSSGKHSYELRYRVAPAIVHYSDNDQLYWNVTGNYWSFRIDHASARVHFPEVIPKDLIQYSGFTGTMGAKGKSFRTEERDANTIFFETTGLMRPGEGLTIVVGSAHGYFDLRTPSAAERFQAGALNLRNEFRGANDFGAGSDSDVFSVVSLIWLAVPVGYFMLTWLFVGINPRAQTILPTDEPPIGLSPAAIRYITRMKYDAKTFAVALINMSVLGHLRITRKGEAYQFALGDTKRKDLTQEGKVVSKALGLTRGKTVHTSQVLGRPLRYANEGLLEYLDDTYRKVYFSRNTKYWLAGVALSALALGAACMSWDAEGSFVLWLLLMAFTLCTIYLLQTGRTLAPALRKLKLREILSSTFYLRGFVIFIALGFAAVILGLFLALVASAWMLLYATVLSAVCLLFGYLLPAPTKLGRAALDSIEGFKLFLEDKKGDAQRYFSEQKDIATAFGSYLPYAIALDIEDSWAEHFEFALAEAGKSVQDLKTKTRSGLQGNDFVLYSMLNNPVHVTNFVHTVDGASKSSSPGGIMPGGGFGGGYTGGGFGGGFAGGGFGGGGGGGW